MRQLDYDLTSDFGFGCVFVGDKYINGEIIPYKYPIYQPKPRKESKSMSKRYERRKDDPPTR